MQEKNFEMLLIELPKHTIISSSSSSLCTVFTLIFLKQTMSLGNTVLQLFYFYYFGACNTISNVKFVMLLC
jgi:hypothetical protein